MRLTAERKPVGADHSRGMPHYGAHIGFVHHLAYRHRAALLLADDAQRRFLRRCPEACCQRCDALALVLRMARSGCDPDLLRLGARQPAGPSLFAERVVLDDRGQRGAARDVRILICRYVETAIARLFDFFQRIVDTSPVLATRGFVMRNLYSNSSLFTDPK